MRSRLLQLIPPWKNPLTPNPNPVPNPQPSHNTAALRSCSTRLLTGRRLLHSQTSLPFNKVPNKPSPQCCQEHKNEWLGTNALPLSDVLIRWHIMHPLMLHWLTNFTQGILKNLTKTVSMWVDSLVNTPQTLWLLQHKAGDPTYIFHWLMLCLSTMEYITVSVYICVSIVSFFSGSMNEACTRGVYFVHLFNKHIFIYCLSSPSVHRPVTSYISTRFVCSPSPFPMLLRVQLPFLCTAQVVVALIIMLIKSSS